MKETTTVVGSPVMEDPKSLGDTMPVELTTEQRIIAKLTGIILTRTLALADVKPKEEPVDKTSPKARAICKLLTPEPFGCNNEHVRRLVGLILGEDIPEPKKPSRKFTFPILTAWRFLGVSDVLSAGLTKGDIGVSVSETPDNSTLWIPHKACRLFLAPGECVPATKDEILSWTKQIETQRQWFLFFDQFSRMDFAKLILQ